MKKAKLLPCLDIIQQFNLLSKETFVDTTALDLPTLKQKKIRPIQPITEYTNYLRSSYKGALDEYARKHFRPRKLIFKFNHFREGDEMVYVATCTTIKGKYVGRERSILRRGQFIWRVSITCSKVGFRRKNSILKNTRMLRRQKRWIVKGMTMMNPRFWGRKLVWYALKKISHWENMLMANLW